MKTPQGRRALERLGAERQRQALDRRLGPPEDERCTSDGCSAASGFFFGLALSVIVLGLDVVKLGSVVLTILPVAGLVLGFLGALWGPRAPRRRAAAPRSCQTTHPRPKVDP